MGFLNKLFGKGTEETDWVQLESEDAVEEVFAASGGRIQLILKHSQSCAVSFFAKQNLDSVPLEEWPEMDRSMVEVVRFRPISQYIAQKTSVTRIPSGFGHRQWRGYISCLPQRGEQGEYSTGL